MTSTTSIHREPSAIRSPLTPQLLAELSLTGVTLALAWSFMRAFTSADTFPTLAAGCVLAHFLSAILRRMRVPVLASTLIAMVVGVVTISLLYYRGYSFYGLPTHETLTHLTHDVRASFGPFRKLVPPVRATPGFNVVLASALWLMATFADVAAFRADAPVQAVAAPIGTFLFSAVLMLNRSAESATTILVLTLGLYALAFRSLRLGRSQVLSDDSSANFPAGSSAVDPYRVWRIGLPLLGVVAAAAIVLTPLVPSPSMKSVVDLRALGRGPKSRVVESPLVDLGALLGGENDSIMFTATSANPHYWRLTSLNVFNGRSWSASAHYRDIESREQLTSPFPSSAHKREESATIRVKDLVSDWIPTPYAPTSVETDLPLRFDADSSSLFVSDETRVAGKKVSIETNVLDVDPTVLAAAERRIPSSLSPYLDLPASFPVEVEALAVELTRGAAPFEAATALQTYFREFAYNRDVDYSSSEEPLTDFLAAREGFCQQFATGFAAMARSIGLPSRVAVGFTYGDRSEKDGVTTWTVRGRHAHAWPEVYINGAGWIAFEPTPSRGNPDTVRFSDVAPSQASSTGDAEVATTTTTTIAPTTTSATATRPTPTRARPRVAASTSNSTPIPQWLKVVGVTIGVATALLGLFVMTRLTWVRRRDQRHRASGAATGHSVKSSWLRTCRDLERLGIVATSSETPAEFAERARGRSDIEQLTSLGLFETLRRFRSEPPTAAEAEEAANLSDEVRTVVWSRLGRAESLSAHLDLPPFHRTR